MAQAHIQEHVDLIAKHEQDFMAQRTQSEKLGDHVATFIGSLTYVAFHSVLFMLWLAFNALPSLHRYVFDPPPFSLLATCLAFEAILVASFILMRQSRLNRRAEERDHLMLQVLIITEREVTALLGIERKMAAHMGLHMIAQDHEVTKLSQQTSIDDVASTIKESLTLE